jgi:uncharacterized protein YegP (UPF0339 family)
MTKQTPRFEVVHTGPAKFHARFIGGNGEPVWTTESYTRKAAAVRAIEVITDEFIYWDQDGCHIPRRDRGSWAFEVRFVDERGGLAAAIARKLEEE